MAQASCGMHWSWDSPMWCSGKKEPNANDKSVEVVNSMCISCPWYKGNNKKIDED